MQMAPRILPLLRLKKYPFPVPSMEISVCMIHRLLPPPPPPARARAGGGAGGPAPEKVPFSSSVDGDLRLHDPSDAHGLKDVPSSKLTPSGVKGGDAFGMDEKFGPKPPQGSSIENGLRDDPSSKLASKVGGMYDDLRDKAKGAWDKFEKEQLHSNFT